MNFNATNKDDPHGVQRLLEILRRQQDSSSSSSTNPPTNPFAISSSSSFNPHVTASQDTSTTSLDPNWTDAAKRRTYNTSNKYNLIAATTSADETPFNPYSFNPFSSTSSVLTDPPALPPKPNLPTKSPPTTTSTTTTRELSTLSFAESLPILSTLSTDTSLLNRLATLKHQQDALENQLVKEFHQFKATCDKQYPNPKLRREQDEKKRKEILKQWDECLKNQQVEFVKMGIPGIRVTSDKRELAKQTKIIHVLSEMVEEQFEEKRAS
ncbi:uncharacterized protein MEPE_02492 [Melanopsichium pennsylvanicum]|uniref:Uncharacterized protein n=2 Tax=Melanopsichium pennsylvanicum TaxID=63383 RepID=A0AAJ4XJH2_9BASI|nr:putative protein [Melanopsichium pennsylvanicum 4]SNX83784.1 uncharacterized protein MEPE_02492 [Melanopsichium pennsylvanicum]